MDCRFEDDLPFSKIFPNLRTLTLGKSEFQKSCPKIGFSFPALTHFAFNFADIYSTTPKGKHEQAELIKLLQLNPQLEHVAIFNYNHVGLHKCVADYLPKLSNLIIRNRCSDLPIEGQDEFCSESVEHFDLQTNSHIVHIPFSFPKLKTLIMNLNFLAVDQSIFDFIAKHKLIKSIRFLCLSAQYPECLHFSYVPSGIEELIIDCVYILNIEMFCRFFQFLKEKRNVKKFSLEGQFSRMSRDEVCQSLCNAMTSDDIEFEVGPVQNVEDSEEQYCYDVQLKEVEIHVSKISNLLKIQSVIKISDIERETFAKVHWYTTE